MSDSISKGATAMLAGSMVNMAIGVLSSVILARVLGPEYKGCYDLIGASIGLGAAVFGLSLASGMVYEVARGGVNGLRLAWHLSLLSILQAAVAGIVLFAIWQTPLISAFVPRQFGVAGVAAIVIGTFAFIIGGYWRAFLSGLQRFVALALVDSGGKAVTATVVIAAVFFTQNDALSATLWATWMMIVSTLAVSLILPAVFLPALRMLQSGSGQTGLGRIFSYSMPCFLGNIIQFLNYRMDVFLIAFFINTHDLGIYVVAVSVAQLLWLPSLALQSILFPKLTGIVDPSVRARTAASVTRKMLALTLVMGLVMAFAGKWLIYLLYGARFQESSLSLSLLLPGIVCFTVANILCSHLAASGRPDLNAIISLIGLVFTVGLNLFLLPRMGIAGAAIATTVSYSASAIATLVFFRNESGISLRDTILFNRNDAIELVKLIREKCRHQG